MTNSKASASHQELDLMDRINWVLAQHMNAPLSRYNEQTPESLGTIASSLSDEEAILANQVDASIPAIYITPEEAEKFREAGHYVVMTCDPSDYSTRLSNFVAKAYANLRGKGTRRYYRVIEKEPN